MILGIDLGTTNSLVAFHDGTAVRLIPNSRGKTVTPSVVGVDGHGTYLIGTSAANQALGNPGRTVQQVKRQIGQRRTLSLGDATYSPEEVSAVILRELRRQAEAFTGKTVRTAVVTVPAHFDDHQRYSTVEASLLAGFRSVHLLNEPTAAALPYTTRGEGTERIVVFDFGGGTLDVTCLERRGREYLVRATVGDGQLGGTDVDRRLADHILSTVETQFGATTAEDPRVRQLVLALAEEAKIDLSERQETEVSVPFLAHAQGPNHLSLTIQRDQLERMVAPLVERARSLTSRALQEAYFDTHGFDRIVLAGGSSRMPAIREMLAREFGGDLAYEINPEEVIAAGAALYGYNLSRGTDGFSLRDVLSGTLAIELADGSCVPLVRKNQTVPVEQTRWFTTVSDHQKEAEIHLVQGNHSQAWRNRSLGRFVLRDIRVAPQGGARIAVSVGVSRDGIVTVRAGDRDTGANQQMVARARPEPARQQVSGNRRDYGDSLLRRLGRLKGLADPDLAVEIDEATAALPQWNADDSAEDILTVLETLLREIVIAVSEEPGKERQHAAS